MNVSMKAFIAFIAAAMNAGFGPIFSCTKKATKEALFWALEKWFKTKRIIANSRIRCINEVRN
jgi:hypothetical protein